MRLLRLGRVDDRAGLGAAALVVLDDGTLAGAGVGLLAGRAVGHLVVELEVAVELGGDVELGDGEAADLTAVQAVERGALGRGGVADTADVVAAGGAAVDARRALAVASLAGEAVPVEVIVAGEATVAQVAEVETAVLVGRALVLAVLGVEGEEVSARGHAGGEREDSGGLHIDCRDFERYW